MPEETGRPLTPSRASRRVLLTLAGLGVTGMAFALVEGLSSTALFVYEIAKARAILAPERYYTDPDERRFTRYDETLGWVSMPNVYIPDLYGSGRYVRTNGRAFRNDEETPAHVPAGKARLICSGDSFTFGQGVANPDTWCHLLRHHIARLETVNLGQRGYGVDQAYLWYMRDGTRLDHGIHVLAFIEGDFGRMQNRSHHGYGKPLLRLDAGELVIDNVPVPRVRLYRPWMSRIGTVAAKLRSVQFVRELRRRLIGSNEAVNAIRKQDMRAVASQIFATLDEVNAAKNSVLVLVYLPIRSNYSSQPWPWQLWLQSLAKSSDLLFIDLVPALSTLPRSEVETLFIPENSRDYVNAENHYTERGNQWVAEVLSERLLALPEVRDKFVDVPTQTPRTRRR